METKPSILKELPLGEAFKKALKMNGEEIIKEVKKSGLRGRGGAGFPTGVKLELTKNAKGATKYVVCNADEGEVGTFKDRRLLREYPEKMLEGMAIAGHVIGSNDCIIYLRWEYQHIRPRIEEAIKKVKKVIHEVNFEIRIGAGAYVCGEETALLDSLEGMRGEARNKPPYPVNEGYLGKPTLINNVETFCCITHIVLEGAKHFASLGPAKDKEPKLFSISGDVADPGIYEFPFGTPLSEAIKLAGAKNPKAVLVGGASGIVVTPKEFNRKLAFGDLPPGGSIIVFNKSRKMVNVLENVMQFFVEESCGQCVPCREGNYRLLKFIEKMKKEKLVTKKEAFRYEELAISMKDASKCGLGQSSPNPYLSIMENFSNEFVKIEPEKSQIPKVCKY